MGDVTFRPSVGLDGFKVVSSFNVESLECNDFKDEVHQLAILLYPPELLNEKFLIKLRECVLKLSENHPLKKWLRWVSQSTNLEEKYKSEYSFLIEIGNSPFNLITDAKMKMRISESLISLPEDTLPEILLKSYLYLMIGNVTRSDNLLKKTMLSPPRVNWTKHSKESLAHRAGKEVSRQIFNKLARHPAERKVFKLFVLYLQSYYNERTLIELCDEVDIKEIESKLNLKAMEIIAPDLIKFLRISSMKDDDRINELSTSRIPLKRQSYWIWPFIELNQLPSEDILQFLKGLEKEDPLWYIYVVSEEGVSEKLARQSINTFLPGYRSLLKNKLNEPGDFMLALLKLIELGDIGHEVIAKTTEHMTNE